MSSPVVVALDWKDPARCSYRHCPKPKDPSREDGRCLSCGEETDALYAHWRRLGRDPEEEEKKMRGRMALRVARRR